MLDCILNCICPAMNRLLNAKYCVNVLFTIILESLPSKPVSQNAQKFGVRYKGKLCIQ